MQLSFFGSYVNTLLYPFWPYTYTYISLPKYLLIPSPFPSLEDNASLAKVSVSAYRVV